MNFVFIFLPIPSVVCPTIIELTLIFLFANSFAKHFTKLFVAAFEDEYSDIPLFPSNEDTEDIETIEEFFLSLYL